MNVNDRLKAGVLALLAFGFLGFYIWFAYHGLDLLWKCKHLPAGVPFEKTECSVEGGSFANSLDFFFAVSGVVSAVAMTALGLKPNALANVVSVLRGTVRFDTNKLVDIMIAAYLLIWVVIGLIVCAKTATLPVEDARTWKLEWLRDAGRTWWPAALTAVALWMGVPSPKSGTSGSDSGATTPAPTHLTQHWHTEMTQNGSHFAVEVLRGGDRDEQSSHAASGESIASVTGIAGRLRFDVPRNGSGGWTQTMFVAMLFEEIVLDLAWNPAVVLLELNCRTRRFNHPIPPPTTQYSISTSLVLLDATDTPLAAPISVPIYRDRAQPVSDTGLVQIAQWLKLDVKGIDMTKVAKVQFFGETLTPLSRHDYAEVIG